MVYCSIYSTSIIIDQMTFLKSFLLVWYIWSFSDIKVFCDDLKITDTKSKNLGKFTEKHTMLSFMLWSIWYMNNSLPTRMEETWSILCDITNKLHKMYNKIYIYESHFIIKFDRHRKKALKIYKAKSLLPFTRCGSTYAELKAWISR